MLEKVIAQKQIITIEKPSGEKRVFKSQANSHKGVIQGLLLKFSNDAKNGIVYSPYELEITFSEALRKYNELKKNTDIVKLELIGWKGKDIIEGYQGFDSEFLLCEHRKDKDTGEVETITHKVSHERVNKLLKFIRSWKFNESRKCYVFAPLLGFETWKDMWKERKLYFEQYYYPIKVLELIGVISYSSRGKITRLK